MKRRYTNQIGSVSVEFPLVVWVLFLVIFFPLLNLTTIALRSYFFSRAVHDATIAAARAGSFSENIDGDLSAVNVSQQVLNNRLRSCTGTNFKKLKVRILQTSLDNMQVTTLEQKLPKAANISKYQYQLELSAEATVSPFVQLDRAFFGSVPGLTTGMSMQFGDRQFVEFPQGLNL